MSCTEGTGLRAWKGSLALGAPGLLEGSRRSLCPCVCPPGRPAVEGPGPGRLVGPGSEEMVCIVEAKGLPVCIPRSGLEFGFRNCSRSQINP